MTRLLLILRPEPGATATAARAGERGVEAVVASLFTVRPVAWPPVPPETSHILFTSANAVRHAGPGLAALSHLPALAVGAATADAARAAGFTDVETTGGDAAALSDHVARLGPVNAVHLCGADHVPVTAPGVTARIVYAADPAPALPDEATAALDAGAIVLLHSARAARSFAGLLDRPRATVSIATISPAVLEAAGAGWARSATADAPTDHALLAAAARLCDQAC